MRGKIMLVVGLATGYVLGSRAGRERYEQIKAGAEKVWNTPAVQSGVHSVQDFAGSKVDAAKDELSKKARSALAAFIGREPLSGPQQSSAAAKAGSTRATPSKPAGRASGSTTASASTANTTPAKAPAAKAAPATKTTAAKKPAATDAAATPESDD